MLTIFTDLFDMYSYGMTNYRRDISVSLVGSILACIFGAVRSEKCVGLTTALGLGRVTLWESGG